MPTPAAELREAASLLRDKATAAIHEDRTTWSTGNTLGSKSPVVVDHPDEPSVLIETYAARLEAVNRYLALLGPATGIALAKLLEHQSRAAAEVEQFLGDEFQDGALDQNVHDALAVARQILGTEATS